MIHLPSLYKGALTLALAGFLCVSTAKATTYTDTINALLPTGKTIDNASSSQLQTALLAATATDPVHAGNYLHDVFAEVIPNSALDFIKIAPSLTKAVILKLPIVSRASISLNIGALVSTNFTLPTAEADKIAYTNSVASGLSKAGNDVIGAFCAGVSTNVSDWFAFSNALILKTPKATAEILYSEIALSGTALQPGRLAASGSLATFTATGAKSAEKGLIAEGIVKASGTANTAALINLVLGLDHGISGKAVTISNLSAFTTSVAGAVAKDLLAPEATAMMGLITKTIASSNVFTGIALTDAQKAQLGAAAVKALPITASLSGDPSLNPANAAVVGILATGTPVDATAFAITVAKGATTFANAGQVANAVANSITPASTLVSGSLAPASYVTFSQAMIKALPKAAAQISERVAQLIPTSGANQAARVNFATQLVNFSPSAAALVAVGVSLTDVQFADDVTAAVVVRTDATKNNAAKIAGAVSEILPAEEACEISRTLGALIGAGTLKVSQAAPIAAAISAGLVKNSLHRIENTPAAIQEELQVVGAQMIEQLLSLYNPGTSNADFLKLNKTLASAIAAVAKSVAKVDYKQYAIKTSSNVDVLSGFANQVAGSAAEAVMIKFGVLGVNDDAKRIDRDGILLAIAKAVQSVTSTAAGDSQVANAVAAAMNQTHIFDTACNVNEQETPVTDF